MRLPGGLSLLGVQEIAEAKQIDRVWKNIDSNGVTIPVAALGGRRALILEWGLLIAQACKLHTNTFFQVLVMFAAVQSYSSKLSLYVSACKKCYSSACGLRSSQTCSSHVLSKTSKCSTYPFHKTRLQVEGLYTTYIQCTTYTARHTIH